MIAVVIVGYNSRSYLEACFNSLEKGNNKDWPIFFIDNASTDDSADFVTKNYPAITTLPQKTNLGFAEANNVGIRAAIKAGAEGIFCLNPDTIVDEKCLDILKKSFTTDKLLQPAILLYKNKKTDKINTTGGVFHYLGYAYVSDYKKSVDAIAARDNLLLASGAAVVIPTSIIKHVGSFDPDFFMYHEDVDLTWRARRAGYKIELIPSAKVWHDYHFSRNKRKFFYVERNRLIFMLKNFSLPYLALTFPIFVLNELASFAYLILQKMPFVKLEAYWSILTMWPEIYKKRKFIQQLQKQQLQPLLPQFTTKLEFSEVKIPAIDIYNQLLTFYWKLIRNALR